VSSFLRILSSKAQTEKVDTLPNGRQLTYGEYRDSSRPLRRLLKQLGSGSLEAGMNVVLTQEEARSSVSQLIGIATQVGTPPPHVILHVFFFKCIRIVRKSPPLPASFLASIHRRVAWCIQGGEVDRFCQENPAELSLPKDNKNSLRHEVLQKVEMADGHACWCRT